MSDHEHDFWISPAGTLVCACGQSKHPIESTAAESAETSTE